MMELLLWLLVLLMLMVVLLVLLLLMMMTVVAMGSPMRHADGATAMQVARYGGILVGERLGHGQRTTNQAPPPLLSTCQTHGTLVEVVAMVDVVYSMVMMMWLLQLMP